VELFFGIYLRRAFGGEFYGHKALPEEATVKS
jgi:hypothetical protein